MSGPFMLPRSCFCLFGLLSLCVSLWGADSTFLGIERIQIERVIAMGYNMDPGTETEIQRLANDYPASPVPGVLEAGFLYWIQKYQEWDEDLKTRFEASAVAALQQGKAYLREHPEDPDARFAVAMVELMQVIYYVDHRRWWAAFWKSRSSLKEMRRLNAEYPNYHDAKLPLGMHNCYMSRTPSYLKPLAFLMRFKGDWDLGVRFMEEARDGGLFCSVDAGYYLSAIRMELEGDRQASRDEMARLVELYPGNLTFGAMLAELDRSLGKQEVSKSRAIAVLADKRSDSFPALQGRTLVTLLWSSLGTQDFELAIDTAERLRGYAGEYGRFDYDLAWLDFVMAEAFLGLGQRAEALSLWASLAEGANLEVGAKAKERLAAVDGVH